MLTQDEDNESSAGSAGQAQAQVHTQDEFAEEPTGKRGTISTLLGSIQWAAKTQPAPIQVNCSLPIGDPIQLQSNSDNDENGWHKDNNSNCEFQVNDKKAATLLVTKSNSDNDANGWHKDNNSDCDYQVDDDNSFVCLANWLTQEDKMQQCIIDWQRQP